MRLPAVGTTNMHERQQALGWNFSMNTSMPNVVQQMKQITADAGWHATFSSDEL